MKKTAFAAAIVLACAYLAMQHINLMGMIKRIHGG